MIKETTKNFWFLLEDEFKMDRKDEIIKWISMCENSNDYKDVQIKVSNILELVLDDFIKNKLSKHISFIPDYESLINLNAKIDFINNTGRIQTSKWFVSTMHRIRNSRNYSVHSHQDKIRYSFSKHHAIVALQDLWTIITTLYLDDSKTFDTFDSNCYYQNDPKKELSAVSKEQREDDQKNKIHNDFVINKDIMKSWLSLKNSEIIIPIYQRGYKWEKDNIEILIDDIQKRMEDREEHYFGIIAQKRILGNSINSPNKIKIIDGQQRLTTSFLIVSVVRDIIIQKKWVNNFEEIDWYYEIIKNHFDKNDLSQIIKNPGGNSKLNRIFQTILKNVEGKQIDLLENMEKNNSFYKNYQVIYNRLTDDFNNEKEKYYSFINTFLNQFSVASIAFDDDNFSNKREMEIFENLNSKGVELNIEDLIKNHIFNFCEEDIINKKEDDIARIYNGMLTSSGINSEDHIENFYLTIAELNLGTEINKIKRKRFISIRNSLDDFLSDFKSLNDLNDFKKMIKKLTEQAKLYAETLSIRSSNMSFIKFIGCCDLINIFDKNKMNLFSYFTFIVHKLIMKNYNNKFDFDFSEQEFKIKDAELKNIQKLFLEVAKFIIRAKVIKTQGDSEVKRKLIGIASKYWKNLNKFSYSINDVCIKITDDINSIYETKYKFEEFKINLIQNSKHSKVKELLILTEYFMTNSLFGKRESVKRKSFSVEHILPINHKKWSDEQLEKDRNFFNEKVDIYKEKIGNYLILDSNSNSEANNEIFKIKKEKVYKDCISRLYQNENNDIDISNKKNWTFEDIDKRTNALITYIIQNIITK